MIIFILRKYRRSKHGVALILVVTDERLNKRRSGCSRTVGLDILAELLHAAATCSQYLPPQNSVKHRSSSQKIWWYNYKRPIMLCSARSVAGIKSVRSPNDGELSEISDHRYNVDAPIEKHFGHLNGIKMAFTCIKIR